MKMVELLIGYDMEKLYSGKVSSQSTDMVTDIHIASDDELTPSERRQFETELSELICKHFVMNKRRLEQDLSKRQYNVKELIVFYVDYLVQGSEDQFYYDFNRWPENFTDKLKSGEIENLSRNFILSTGLFKEQHLDQFDNFLESIKSKIKIQKELVSTPAIRHVLVNMVGLSEEESLALFGSRGQLRVGGAFVYHYDMLVPLNEIEYALERLNYPLDALVSAMIKYTKDHPIVDPTQNPV